MNDTKAGSFVWYELMTTDPEAAIPFYTDVTGWTTQPFGDGGYTMWVSDQGPLGGVMKLPEQASSMGAPPHWIANVQVADVDVAVALTRKLGGHVHVEPKDIPTVGRVAVIADPQGAAISVFTPAQAMRAHDTARPGQFTWSELLTTDHEAAFAFYTALFGWERIHEHDMGPMGKYLIYGQGSQQYGGMFTKPKDMAMPPAWLYYVHVADLDAALARATAKGAKVMNGPMEVPGGSRIVQLMDPQGVAFALHADGAKAA